MMRRNRELPSGGTIGDRIPKRPKPENIDEFMDQMIEDWDICLKAFKELEEETPTFMQMYAMKGSIVLVNEFREDLQKLSDFVKKGEGVGTPPVTQEQRPKDFAVRTVEDQEAPSRKRLIAPMEPGTIPVELSAPGDPDVSVQPAPTADARLRPQTPIVDIKPGTAQLHTPPKTQGETDSPSGIYVCRADHIFDEETAKSVNFHCPQCRMLLRRPEEYER